MSFDVCVAARLAAEKIAPLATRIESERRLPPEAVAALIEARVFKLAVPRVYGGVEASANDVVLVLEALAHADGSAAWCAMIGATSGMMSIFLEDDVANEIYTPEDVITCGVTAPLGHATPTPQGYRVTGRWPFASGCELSSWRMGGAIVAGEPPLPNGMPNPRCMIFRADQTHIHDTWHTSGLRGTGSHDIEVTDALVPIDHSFSLITDRPMRYGGACAMPFFGLLAASVAAVGVGIARGALDAFIGLAAAKHQLGAKRTIAYRELVQNDVARASAMVRGAHALLMDAVGQASREIEKGDAPSIRTRAELRAAAVHATSEAAGAVDIVYNAAGATGIYSKSPLQRHFRDVHVVTQHIMVAPTAAVLAGRILLGVETDTSLL